MNASVLVTEWGGSDGDIANIRGTSEQQDLQFTGATWVRLLLLLLLLLLLMLMLTLPPGIGTGSKARKRDAAGAYTNAPLARTMLQRRTAQWTM